MPLATVSSSVSVSNWRAMRVAPAPIAARMAISLRRAVSRARSNPARLMHATPSTIPTATNSGMSSAVVGDCQAVKVSTPKDHLRIAAG